MTIVIKRFKNSAVAKIEELLSTGPMTRAELQDGGVHRESMGSILTRLSHESGPQSPQRIHICGWTSEHPGMRSYPRAIYALGPGENAKKPKARDHSERSRAYQRKAKTAVANVFELGAHVKTKIERTRQRRAVERQIKEGTAT